MIREVGDVGGEAVLLVHGLAGSSLEEWYRVGPLLTADRRLLMVDLRGHGLSALSRDRFDVEEVADDLAAVIDQLGVGPVAVVGYSMGGVIAQSLAVRWPGLVRRLALVATMSHHPRWYRIGRQIGVYAARAWERLTGLGTPEVRGGYLRAVNAVEDRHARWLWEQTHRRDPDAGAEATFALLRFDSRPYLPKLELPVLVVIPTEDQLVPPRWQYQLASSIPGARLVEIVGAHHEVPWTHAERLATELASFLDA